MLQTYYASIEEAYKELAAQRKRGGTASRGIAAGLKRSGAQSYKDSIDCDNPKRL